MNQVFNADYSVLPEIFFDDSIIREGNALPVDLSITSFIDQFADALEIWITISNISKAVSAYILCE